MRVSSCLGLTRLDPGIHGPASGLPGHPGTAAQAPAAGDGNDE